MREPSGSGAASVASQLRAFLKDPAHWRPRLLRGKDPLPDGSFVLRFAQGRFPRGLMRDLALRERDEVRDAANAFIRQVCFWEGATHYQVLCAAQDARGDAIKERYQLMMALIHPDRQDATLEPWPNGCAQRVNQAYDILSNAELRREYDASLHRAAAGSTFPPHMAQAARGKRRTRVGLAKTLVILGAVIATPLLLEAWFSDPSDGYSMLQSAFSVRRARDGIAGSEQPRYLGADPQPARQPAAGMSVDSRRAEEFSFFDPLWRVFASAPAAPPVVSLSPTRVADVAISQRVPPKPEPVEPAAAVEPPAQPKNASMAQAQAPAAVKAPASAQSAVSARDIEILVARLIGYYEAGETEKLMSLLDSADAGFWQTARTRQAYYDFFRATRQRKLRVNNLAWQTANHSAQAKGEATVVAEYFDTPGMLERRVEVEMDIALRDGMPKITRLSLFPDVR
jgi:hypothetical protein